MRPATTTTAALALALHLGDARAQQPPATTNPPAASDAASVDGRALALLAEGLDALDRADAEAALRALRESFRLRPRAVTMVNIAQAYRRAGMPVQAIQSYEEYVRLAEGEGRREHVAQVRATIALIRRTTAWIDVDTQPAGATVRLDGLLRGTTPLGEPLAVGAGEHALELALPGHVPLREQVTVAAGRTLRLRPRLADTMTAATLSVALLDRAPGARVAVDGMTVGAPPVSRRLEPGGHRVEVTAPAHEAFRAEIVLAATQRRSLAVRLEPVTPVLARPWFWVVTGVLVAGAVTAGVVLAMQPPAPPPSGLIEVPGLAHGM